MVRKSVREAKLPGDHITLPALPEKLPVFDRWRTTRKSSAVSMVDQLVGVYHYRKKREINENGAAIARTKRNNYFNHA